MITTSYDTYAYPELVLAAARDRVRREQALRERVERITALRHERRTQWRARVSRLLRGARR
jgi:hypothetical protein